MSAEIETIVISGSRYPQLTSNDDRAIEREFKKYFTGFFGYFTPSVWLMSLDVPPAAGM